MSKLAKIKKIFLALLIFVMAFSLFSCRDGGEVKEITCQDILKAYEDAGYYVIHSQHCGEEDYYCRCYLVVQFNEEDEPSDHVYFTMYWTEEEAKDAAKTDDYNIAKWIFALIFGESRWLKAGTYGTIAYSYYNAEMIKPFEKLTQ